MIFVRNLCKEIIFNSFKYFFLTISKESISTGLKISVYVYTFEFVYFTSFRGEKIIDIYVIFLLIFIIDNKKKTFIESREILSHDLG